jgi:tetratricopeptide (TPR) repeat protein
MLRIYNPERSSLMTPDPKPTDPAIERRARAEAAEATLRTQLAQGADVAAAYVAAFAELAEILVRQEPAALDRLAATAPLEHLADPSQRRLMRFYCGLGAGLAERFGPAEACFAELLIDPDLEAEIRGRALNSGAVFARIQGDYERARDGFRQSRAVWEQLGSRQREGGARLNTGVLHYYLQEYAAAEAELQAAQTLFVAAGAAHAEGLALMNLGLVNRDRGRWMEATAQFAAAEAIFTREGAGDHLGAVINNRGEVALLCGRYTEAAALFQRALTTMQTQIYRVDALLNLGLFAQATGDHAAAQAHYLAAQSTASAAGRSEIAALVEARLAHVAAALGDPTAAAAHYVAALEAIERQRRPLRDEGLLISLMGRWQSIYEAALLFALEQGDTAQAFYYAERARARAFADALLRSGADTPAVAPVDAAATCAALPADTALLATFTTGMRGPEHALLDALPPEAVAVRTYLTPLPALIVFHVTPQGVTARRSALDPNLLIPTALDADGRRFLRPAIVQRLSRELFGPLPAWPARLIIAPHGPLHQLSWCALTGPSGEPMALNGPTLSAAPSATVLVRAAPHKRQAPRTCLALGHSGAPALGLRHTEAEASEVAALCAGAQEQATPGVLERFAATAAEYRILHLACHGEFRFDDPLGSYLQLAPDERLRAVDVLNGWRLNADLVTLSACRSGLSRVLRGDEPLGLVRAFLGAGARTVLVTLWPVEDHSARLLMRAFYRTLLSSPERFDPAAALRTAQLALRNHRAADGSLPYVDPAFWAPYVLIGQGV